MSQRHASALTRQVGSILLVIEGACGSNEHERATRSQLVKLALVQAMKYLSRDRPDIGPDRWTSACVGCMHLGYALIKRHHYVDDCLENRERAFIQLTERQVSPSHHGISGDLIYKSTNRKNRDRCAE